jgi:hypothetical protein
LGVDFGALRVGEVGWCGGEGGGVLVGGIGGGAVTGWRRCGGGREVWLSDLAEVKKEGGYVRVLLEVLSEKWGKRGSRGDMGLYMDVLSCRLPGGMCPGVLESGHVLQLGRRHGLSPRGRTRQG